MIRCVVSKTLTLTPDSANEIVRYVKEGYKVEFVGAATAARVHRKRRRRIHAIPSDTLREMVALRRKGTKVRIIARRYGLSISGAGNAIRKALKKGGAA